MPQAVADFTRFATRHACPTCGGRAYLEATRTGVFRVRWRCDHDAAMRQALDDAMRRDDEHED